MGVASVIGWVIGVVFFVLTVIALWKIFVKAGEKGWKAIIPFYNLYVLFKLVWRPLFFWLCLVLTVVYSVLNVVLQTNFMIVSRGTQTIVPSAMANPVFWILTIATFAIIIVLIVWSIKYMHYLSKAFGHGAGWTVGLVFLFNIFLLMLGFGKSEYKGNQYLETNKKI